MSYEKYVREVPANYERSSIGPFQKFTATNVNWRNKYLVAEVPFMYRYSIDKEWNQKVDQLIEKVEAKRDWERGGTFLRVAETYVVDDYWREVMGGGNPFSTVYRDEGSFDYFLYQTGPHPPLAKHFSDLVIEYPQDARLPTTFGGSGVMYSAGTCINGAPGRTKYPITPKDFLVSSVRYIKKEASSEKGIYVHNNLHFMAGIFNDANFKDQELNINWTEKDTEMEIKMGAEYSYFYKDRKESISPESIYSPELLVKEETNSQTQVVTKTYMAKAPFEGPGGYFGNSEKGKQYSSYKYDVKGTWYLMNKGLHAYDRSIDENNFGYDFDLQTFKEEYFSDPKKVKIQEASSTLPIFLRGSQQAKELEYFWGGGIQQNAVCTNDASRNINFGGWIDRTKYVMHAQHTFNFKYSFKFVVKKGETDSEIFISSQDYHPILFAFAFKDRDPKEKYPLESEYGELEEDKVVIVMEPTGVPADQPYYTGNEVSIPW